MEYERLQSQFHVQRIEDMGWDALNQALLVVAAVGPEDGSRSSPLVFSLSPEAVSQLGHVLPQALAGRPGAAAPRQ